MDYTKIHVKPGQTTKHQAACAKRIAEIDIELKQYDYLYCRFAALMLVPVAVGGLLLASLGL